jgi:hypothetical protein
MTVHRIIEEQASRIGDRAAIADVAVTLSYRQLNQRANGFARHLIARGFRRRSLAIVRLRRSPETAIVLLGILKAGGTYSLMDDERDWDAWPSGAWFEQDGGDEEGRLHAVDLASALAQPVPCVANLPVIARGNDVACVLQGRHGAPLVMVAHETIAALQLKRVSRVAPWAGEPGALDLWMALMAGATVALDGHLFESAA